MNTNRTSGRRLAVIVLVNAMPRLYIESLVSQLANSHDVKILTFYRSTLFDAVLSARLIAASVELHQYHFRGRFGEFIKLRRAGKLLRQWMSSPDVDAFHCQPNHFLTNYLTFRCIRKPGIRVHLIPDGVANFYLTKTAPYERSMRVKSLVGPLLGLPFRSYRGNYLALGCASYSSYWYFSNAGMMARHLPLVEFPAPDRPANNRRAAALLFLGQPTSGQPEFDSAYQSVLERVLMRSSRAYYKPHPAERMSSSRRKSLEDAGFTIVDTKESAENLASGYEVIAGIASSVLFNVRLLGWNDTVLGVDSPTQLEVLLGRERGEISEITSAAAAVGIQSL